MKDDDLAADLLDGIPAIAAYLGCPFAGPMNWRKRGSFRFLSWAIENGRAASRRLGGTLRA